MALDRQLPTRSPVAYIARALGTIPHGLPTAVTFSGATVAFVASALVGASALVLPGRLNHSHPPGTHGVPMLSLRTGVRQEPEHDPVPTTGANPVTVRAVSVNTGAGSPNAASAVALTVFRPGPTSPPDMHRTPQPTAPAPTAAAAAGRVQSHSPDDRDDDEGHRDGGGWPTHAAVVAAAPTETLEPRGTAEPRESPRATPEPRPTPTPRPAPTASPSPAPTPPPNDD